MASSKILLKHIFMIIRLLEIEQHRIWNFELSQREVGFLQLNAIAILSC